MESHLRQDHIIDVEERYNSSVFLFISFPISSFSNLKGCGQIQAKNYMTKNKPQNNKSQKTKSPKKLFKNSSPDDPLDKVHATVTAGLWSAWTWGATAAVKVKEHTNKAVEGAKAEDGWLSNVRKENIILKLSFCLKLNIKKKKKYAFL
jgi:hypothetical protein